MCKRPLTGCLKLILDRTLASVPDWSEMPHSGLLHHALLPIDSLQRGLDLLQLGFGFARLPVDQVLKRVRLALDPTSHAHQSLVLRVHLPRRLLVVGVHLTPQRGDLLVAGVHLNPQRGDLLVVVNPQRGDLLVVGVHLTPQLGHLVLQSAQPVGNLVGQAVQY